MESPTLISPLSLDVSVRVLGYLTHAECSSIAGVSRSWRNVVNEVRRSASSLRLNLTARGRVPRDLFTRLFPNLKRLWVNSTRMNVWDNVLKHAMDGYSSYSWMSGLAHLFHDVERIPLNLEELVVVFVAVNTCFPNYHIFSFVNRHPLEERDSSLKKMHEYFDELAHKTGTHDPFVELSVGVGGRYHLYVRSKYGDPAFDDEFEPYQNTSRDDFIDAVKRKPMTPRARYDRLDRAWMYENVRAKKLPKIFYDYCIGLRPLKKM